MNTVWHSIHLNSISFAIIFALYIHDRVLGVLTQHRVIILIAAVLLNNFRILDECLLNYFRIAGHSEDALVRARYIQAKSSDLVESASLALCNDSHLNPSVYVHCRVIDGNVELCPAAWVVSIVASNLTA